MNKKDKDFLTKLADLMDEYDINFDLVSNWDGVEFDLGSYSIEFMESIVIKAADIREAIGDDL